MHSRAADRRSASECQGKWPDQTLDQAFGLPEVLVAISTSRLSCKRAGKTRTLMPVWDSSGESQLQRLRHPDFFRSVAGVAAAMGFLASFLKSVPVVRDGRKRSTNVTRSTSTGCRSARPFLPYNAWA